MLPSQRPRLIFLAKAFDQGGYAHKSGYYLSNGRWHKIQTHKPAPKGAPVAAHPHAGGVAIHSASLTEDQWKALELPADNVNAASYHKQLATLKGYAEAGNVTAIVGWGYGVNTYGKKLAKVANHLLGLMGSAHTVSPGQKPGWHAAVEHHVEPSSTPVVAPVPVAADPEPAVPEPVATPAPKVSAVDKHALLAIGGKEWVHPTTGEVRVYFDAAEALGLVTSSYGTGNISGAKLNGEKISNTAAKKMLNSIGSAKLYWSEASGTFKATGLGSTYFDNALANIKGKLASAASAPIAAESTPPPANPEPAAVPAYKPAPYKPAALDPTVEKIKISFQAHVDKYVAAGDKATLTALHKQNLHDWADTMVVNGLAKLAADEAAANEPAPAAKPEPASAASNLDSIPWDKLVLPDTNTNAASHNKKVAAIKAAAYAGNVAALNAMKFGSNTYGKKQQLLHATALAALAPTAAPESAPAKAAPASDKIVTLPGHSQKFKEDPHAVHGWVFQHSESSEWHEVLNSGAVIELNAKVGNAAPAVPSHDAMVQWLVDAPDVNPVGMLEAWQALPAHVKTELTDKAHDIMDSKPSSLSSQAKGNPAPAAGHVPAAHMLNLAMQAGLDIGTAAQKWLDLHPSGDQELSNALVAAGHVNVATDMDLPHPDEDDGPHDGDTKPGANGGTLVFKDGHWHLQDSNLGAPVHENAVASNSVDAIAIPTFEKSKHGKYAALYTSLAEKLKAAVAENGIAGLKGHLVNHANGTFTVDGTLLGVSLKIKKFGPDTGSSSFSLERQAAMHKFITELKAAAGNAPKVKKATAAKPVAKPKPAAPDLTGLPSIDSWEQTGGQGGSNPGGKFKDADGVEWYCKFPSDPEHARSEVLAAKLYEAAGISAQNAKLITRNGKLGIASLWTEVKQTGAEGLHAAPGALSGFAVDAWLANHDVVGMGFDNMQVDAEGKAMRVDAGGSLQYRAQGAKKAFGEKVTEIDSMRDASINPYSAAVFGALTEADITASAKLVLAITDERIFDLVMEHGPISMQDKSDLIDALVARKADLAERFPKAVPREKKKAAPDPTKLKVDASQLPKPHDFLNWNGAGNPLSSKGHVNASNAAAEKALLDLALQGNLVALKDAQFEAVDKESGESLGKKPINQHPSNHVKTFWSDLVSSLSYIAYPPEALKKFKTVIAASVAKISQAFKSEKYGVTTAKVDANSRLAFWIALGSTKPVEHLMVSGASLDFVSEPKGQPEITNAQTNAAKAAYQSLTSSRLVKRFINGIQGSGSYNDNFRDGRMITTDGHDAIDMVLDAYSYATEKPEGFELYKWISFPGDMGKQMLSAPPGTVFQNPGSMCASTGANGTAGFGSDRVRIRYAAGAKGVDSFGSGNFKIEKEITTLPGQRFVILKCHKVMCPVKGKERIELDVLMLPPDPTYVAELEAMKGNK